MSNTLLTQVYSIAGAVLGAGLSIAARWNDKARQIVEGRKLTIERLQQSLSPGKRRVWFHVASLGEFEQARPLIEGLRQRHQELEIILSFFSPSGYSVRKDYTEVDVVVYLPNDTLGSVRKFLDTARPDTAIFVKYELWPTMLSELYDRGVRTFLVSAIFRPNQLFFRPWGGWYRGLLRTFEHIYVQDDESLRLLNSIGVSSVSIVGDTRFDRVEQIARSPQQVEAVEVLREQFAHLLVAGSTWPADDQLLLLAWQGNSDYGLVLAPHELHSDYIDTLVQGSERPLYRLSELVERSRTELEQLRIDGIVVDNFGLLSSLYQYAHVAYIGGGFGKGIHNSIEAAVYGLPVLFGPKINKFREAKDLVACEAAYIVQTTQDLVALLERFHRDDAREQGLAAAAARRYVASQLGATNLILDSI